MYTHFYHIQGILVYWNNEFISFLICNLLWYAGWFFNGTNIDLLKNKSSRAEEKHIRAC